MACNIISTRGAVFVLWGVPTLEDLELVVIALKKAVDQCCSFIDGHASRRAAAKPSASRTKIPLKTAGRTRGDGVVSAGNVNWPSRHDHRAQTVSLSLPRGRPAL
jgi:hypothetical protein